MNLLSARQCLGDLVFFCKDALGHYKIKNCIKDTTHVPLNILMYHGISGSQDFLENHPLDVSAQSCLNEIKFHIRQGYQPVSSPAVRGEIRTTPTLMITFDDGNLNCFNLIRHLCFELKIPVLLAICPQVIENKEIFWFEELKARIILTNNNKIKLFGHVFENKDRHQTSAEVLEFYFNHKNILSEQLMESIKVQTTDVNSEQLVNSGYIHENMDWSHLKQLLESGNLSIAAHSLFHEAATNMDDASFEQDAQKCKEIIEHNLEVNCIDYVYPFGAVDSDSSKKENILFNLGYSNTYTVQPKVNLDNNTRLLGRFKGTRMEGSKRYYGYLWQQKHESLKSVVGANI